MGDIRAQPALVKALAGGDDSVRLWAAAGLERIGDESCVEALIEALGDPYELVRGYAVHALAKIGEERAVEPLIKTLDDEDMFVRGAALDSLRDAFWIEYDPVTKQTTAIPREKPVEFESLPVEEQRIIKRQLQVVYNKINEMDQVSSPVRDDKLYDSLCARAPDRSILNFGGIIDPTFHVLLPMLSLTPCTLYYIETELKQSDTIILQTRVAE